MSLKVGNALTPTAAHLTVLFGGDVVVLLRELHRTFVINERHRLGRLKVLCLDVPNSWVERWFVFVSHGLSC